MKSERKIKIVLKHSVIARKRQRRSNLSKVSKIATRFHKKALVMTKMEAKARADDKGR